MIRETAAVLKEQGEGLLRFPVVVQYNKRGLKDAIDLEDLQARFNPWDTDYVPAVAKEGKGVLETFEKIVKNVLVGKYARNTNI